MYTRQALHDLGVGPGTLTAAQKQQLDLLNGASEEEG